MPEQDPSTEALVALQARYLQQQAALWSRLLAGSAGGPASAGDARFSAREWSDSPYYAYLRESYQLASNYLSEATEALPLQGREKDRLRFMVRQWLDAASPANFAATNPRVIQEAIATGGESITRGVAQFYDDISKRRLSQTDESAFEVGRNLAVTPGSVVQENELMQLIRYRPLAARVGKQPLVIVPPCINKFYVLDLQPHNSFVRYAVSQGHDVFMVSWRNVGVGEGHLNWDDYLQRGVIEALRTAREIARADRVNALGFCVGGTLLATALAVLAASDDPIAASATYLTTLLDFSEPGVLGIFVDEASLAAQEAAIGAGGILHGSELAALFSSLRANDLVWPYVEGNYLLGRRPPAFDILYWNADSTNLPGPMLCSYLRNTYLENRLCVPSAVRCLGAEVDLGRPALPSYVVATREDHIVPWRAAYRSLAVLGGESRFVLGASGHIAGVVNPPEPVKRSYWAAGEQGADPEQWLRTSSERKGSWWPDWSNWLAARSGGERKAPLRLGGRRFREIEPAPGRYVKERIGPR